MVVKRQLACCRRRRSLGRKHFKRPDDSCCFLDDINNYQNNLRMRHYAVAI